MQARQIYVVSQPLAFFGYWSESKASSPPLLGRPSLLHSCLRISPFSFQPCHRLPNLLAQEAIPDDACKTTDQHQHWEVPQRVVAQAGTGSKDDKNPTKSISDRFFRQLHCRERDDADSGGVHAR